MYSEKVMQHFSNPKNAGELPDANGEGLVGNPVCGDVMKIYIKVEGDRIADIRFKTFGCGAAIATSDMVCDLVLGCTLDQAMTVSNRAVAEALDGLPAQKMHCSNLAADALHAAIADYRKKAGLRAAEGKVHDTSVEARPVSRAAAADGGGR